MTRTSHVEMRQSEQWTDVAEAFVMWCLHEKQISSGGCHEGDAVVFADGKRYAAISIPDQSPQLIDYLNEWAEREGRAVR